MAHLKESKYSWTLFRILFWSWLAISIVQAHPPNRVSIEENSVHYDRSFVSASERERILSKIRPPKAVSEIVNLTCSLPTELIDEIASYQTFVNDVSHFVFDGVLKGMAYEAMARFVDKFGSRIVGSQNLENSVDYLTDFMTQLGFENIHTENATVPHWTR